MLGHVDLEQLGAVLEWTLDCDATELVSFGRHSVPSPRQGRSGRRIAVVAVAAAVVATIIATAAALDELMDTNAELFASLRRRERTTDLAIVPDELDEDSVALSGYAKATWNELLAAAGRGDAVARDALMLLYRLGHREA